MTMPSVTPDHVAARATVFRVAAALLDYPLPETHQALQQGRVAEVLSEAMQRLGEAPWPSLPVTASQSELEVGYTATFVLGERGRPRVPLTATGYESLLAGDTPGNFMLNVQAFYRHFGLKPAIEDEGHADEPDHLVTMLEFCTLLCHLEQQALLHDRDAAFARRALRDFLARYLIPLSEALRERFRSEPDQGLDGNLTALVLRLPDWAQRQCDTLEHQVGPCPLPGQRPAAAESAGMWD